MADLTKLGFQPRLSDEVANEWSFVLNVLLAIVIDFSAQVFVQDGFIEVFI